MFSTSSQRKCWTFRDENQLANLREKHNSEFITKYGPNNEYQKYTFFLSPEEERLLLKQYEIHLRDFCKRFNPPMPKGVFGTAFHYFKRFYLYNSTMEYHPKDILATCIYLACKVEEFNVSITQFLANIKGDREKALDIILNNELLLMQHLNYDLTIHNPFRAVEGFLIDIKTRSNLDNPERLRCDINEFLDKVFLTDACLLYAPSQIALSAVLHAASKQQENLDTYVTDILFRNTGDKLAILVEAVRKIRSMVKMVEAPQRENIKMIEKKLEQCRNQENAQSEAHRKMRDGLHEDDLHHSGTSRMSLDSTPTTN